jgi:hypothetical protein
MDECHHIYLIPGLILDSFIKFQVPMLMPPAAEKICLVYPGVNLVLRPSLCVAHAFFGSGPTAPRRRPD